MVGVPPDVLGQEFAPRCYRAFGLRIHSNGEIPGLRQVAFFPSPDIQIELGSAPPDWTPLGYTVWYESGEKKDENKPFLIVRKSSDCGYWMEYPDGIYIWICASASQIWITWSDESCVDEVATFLLASVMAFVAQLRGISCLHGCAVAVDGSITAILGEPGAGKSTTAATFANLGYPVASDDLVVVREESGRFVVDPSFPVVRLWPETVERIYGDEDALPLLSPQWTKRALRLEPGYSFQDSALPLSSIYVLGPRSSAETTPYIVPITGADAILALVSNSWARYVNRPELLAPQLNTWTRMARLIPIRRVFPHTNIARLPALCRFLAEDARECGVPV